MLLLARAMGFGSGLSSGQALGSSVLRRAFELSEGEDACCFVSFGTVAKSKAARTRPAATQILSTFEA